jgi:hypothetical protein
MTPSWWVRLPTAAGDSVALVVKKKADGQANEHEGPQAERGDCDGGEMCEEHERTRDVVDFASPTGPHRRLAGFSES